MQVETNSRPEAVEGNIGDSVNSQANEALSAEARQLQTGDNNINGPKPKPKPEPDYIDFNDQHGHEQDESDKTYRRPYTINADGTITMGTVKSQPID